MTKENYKIYDKSGDVFCLSCEEYKPVDSYCYTRIKTNTREATRCKTCEWFNNKDEDWINSLPYDNDTIRVVVCYMLESKNRYINELMNVLNLSVYEMYQIIKDLKMTNIHILYRYNCEYCGKLSERKLSEVIKNKNLYCSYECYWNDKPSKINCGKESIFYNRIDTFCNNCNRPMSIIPSRYNKTNSFGDNHHFCSHKCYSEYRSKYYINDKASMKGYIYSDEQKENKRNLLLSKMQDSNRLNTSIQLKINTLLNNMNILFEREKCFDYYSVDNYLILSNLIIEVMGDYWHVNPNKYNKKRYLINEMQSKQLHRDKVKYSYIKNNYNINILYLWETDILNNIELCKKIIFEYVKNNGYLLNYHSFNYYLEEDSLFLSNDIIKPYQDMSIDEYRNLIKKKVG